jgi:hypothetical protein
MLSYPTGSHAGVRERQEQKSWTLPFTSHLVKTKLFGGFETLRAKIEATRVGSAKSVYPPGRNTPTLAFLKYSLLKRDCHS